MPWSSPSAQKRCPFRERDVMFPTYALATTVSFGIRAKSPHGHLNLVYAKPALHQMSDTIATLDLPFFASVIDGLEQALGEL